MKILATFDARDYEGTTGIYEKYSIRAIIVRDGRLAMQCSREGEYKIPGGGQEPGENYEQTLIREVKEETGLYVRPESICDELTQVDIDKMKEELQHRIQVLRPQLIEEVKVARSFGDLSENFEYKAAKREKNRNDSRIRYLENMIKTAVVIDGTAAGDGVALFDKVTFYLEEEETEETIQLVTTLRQDALKGLISKESPV